MVVGWWLFVVSGLVVLFCFGLGWLLLVLLMLLLLLLAVAVTAVITVKCMSTRCQGMHPTSMKTDRTRCQVIWDSDSGRLWHTSTCV